MKRRKHFATGIAAAFIAVMLAVMPAHSQLKPIKFEMDSLPNGLKIIYCVDKSAPVVATVLYYKVGSHYELAHKTGYAHFFEHLMFEATTDIPRSTIPQYVQSAGGSLNAHTAFDQTVFYYELPSNEIKLGLWLDSERMRKLKIDSIGVATQKGVVLEEKKMRSDNTPYGTLLEKMTKNLFTGSFYSWEVIGYAEDIQQAKISDFRMFYDEYYQPNNAILSICGDIDIPQVKQLVKEYYGIYPRAKDPVRPQFKIDPLEKEYREEVIDDKAQLPGVFVGFRGARLGEDDFYPLSLLTDVLASGESSRLYQRLVDKDQIAVASAVFPLSLEYGGGILLYAIATPGKDIKEVEKTMYEEIDNLIKNGISAEELTKAKNITEAQFVNGKKNVNEKAETLAQYLAMFGDPKLINNEIDRYLKVTKEDIMRVAKKYFGTDKRVVLTYIPKAMKESETK